MNLFILFDTSIGSTNLGDLIIMDAIRSYLPKIVSDSQVVRLPTHLPLSREGRYLSKKSVGSLVGGTNLLTSNYFSYRQWKVGLRDLISLNHSILCGVGWWQYQKAPDIITKLMLRRILSKQRIHSVRDNYTKKQLLSIGIKNVVNTGCPTIWNLNKVHCSEIPTSKSSRVIFTLTDYLADSKRDTYFVKKLLKSYTSVTFWPQGSRDLQYINELGFKDSVDILEPNLHSFNSFLEMDNVDYVGTRLHGGIRALQLKNRSLIIGIDNRSLEKAKDFNLPVLARDNIENLDEMIESEININLNLPEENIKYWLSQFNPK